MAVVAGIVEDSLKILQSRPYAFNRVISHPSEAARPIQKETRKSLTATWGSHEGIAM